MIKSVGAGKPYKIHEMGKKAKKDVFDHGDNLCAAVSLSLLVARYDYLEAVQWLKLNCYTLDHKLDDQKFAHVFSKILFCHTKGK